MRILFFLLTFLCSSFLLQGQIGFTHNKGARLLALGNSGASNTGIDAIFSNPAGLTGLENFGMIVSTERRFELSEIIIGSAGIAKKLGAFGYLGLSASTLQFEDYREQKFGLSYARLLTKGLSISATADYIMIQIGVYGSSNVFSYEVGLHTKVSDKVSIGAHVFSPVQVSINESNTLQTEFRLGINYSPSKKVDIYADFSKNIDFAPRVHIGVEYQMNKLFSILVGTSTAPSTFGFGLGFNLSDFKIHGAASRHSYLGTTPAVSLSYEK